MASTTRKSSKTDLTIVSADNGEMVFDFNVGPAADLAETLRGRRALLGAAYLFATTEQREQIVEFFSPGMVRRALLVIAKSHSLNEKASKDILRLRDKVQTRLSSAA